MTRTRSRSGSIAAEHMAALVVLFLGILYPLVNISTCGYRYCLALQGVHNGLHYGSTAQTWSAGTSPTAVMTVVPNVTNNYFSTVKGITNPVLKTRLLETNMTTGVVTRLTDNAKLPYAPKTGFIYALELTFDCDIAPLIAFKNQLIPDVPGMTGPYHASITNQELLENPSGMTN